MSRRRATVTKSCFVLLALLIGQVQAQSVFKCALMDEVVRGECCCTTNRTAEDCGDSACDDPTNGPPERCCDRSVELRFNADAQDERPVTKPFELRTGVDPPPAAVCSIALNALAPTRSALAIPSLPSDAHLIRSDTYLITQRLRI
jgi:hypothetical protein